MCISNLKEVDYFSFCQKDRVKEVRMKPQCRRVHQLACSWELWATFPLIEGNSDRVLVKLGALKAWLGQPSYVNAAMVMAASPPKIW